MLQQLNQIGEVLFQTTLLGCGDKNKDDKHMICGLYLCLYFCDLWLSCDWHLDLISVQHFLSFLHLNRNVDSTKYNSFNQKLPRCFFEVFFLKPLERPNEIHLRFWKRCPLKQPTNLISTVSRPHSPPSVALLYALPSPPADCGAAAPPAAMEWREKLRFLGCLKDISKHLKYTLIFSMGKTKLNKTPSLHWQVKQAQPTRKPPAR